MWLTRAALCLAAVSLVIILGAGLAEYVTILLDPYVRKPQP